MIVLPILVAHCCRALFRRLLPRGSPRTKAPAVGLKSGPDGVRLRCATEEVAFEYCNTASCEQDSLVVPLEALGEGDSRAGEIQIRALDSERVEVRQSRRGKEQTREYSCKDLTVPEFPAWPGAVASNGRELLAALDQAAQTTARDGTRFALHRIKLRGKKGEVVATDGKQLLIHGGFSWPWQQDLLVPSTTVFGCSELAQAEQVLLALSSDHVLIRCGSCTVALKIAEGERFPDIDTVIPAAQTRVTNWRLEPTAIPDLLQALRDLPGAEQELAPVTLDLGRVACLRARADGQSRVTEHVVAGSTVEGMPMRLAMNRRYLARACTLGFTTFSIVGAQKPIVCRDARRTYLAMPFDVSDILPAQSGSVPLHPPGTTGRPGSRVRAEEPQIEQRVPQTAAAVSANKEGKSQGWLTRWLGSYAGLAIWSVSITAASAGADRGSMAGFV